MGKSVEVASLIFFAMCVFSVLSQPVFRPFYRLVQLALQQFFIGQFRQIIRYADVAFVQLQQCNVFLVFIGTKD